MIYTIHASYGSNSVCQGVCYSNPSLRKEIFWGKTHFEIYNPPMDSVWVGVPHICRRDNIPRTTGFFRRSGKEYPTLKEILRLGGNEWWIGSQLWDPFHSWLKNYGWTKYGGYANDLLKVLLSPTVYHFGQDSVKFDVETSWNVQDAI